MGKNGDKELTARRPLLPEFDNLWDLVRFDTRWPFAFPSRTLRLPDRELAAVDMFEKDGNVVVKAEMPGIDPDKIDVTVVGGELRISGERSEEKEVKDEHYYRSERSFGRIYRALTLPEGCDADHVEASSKNGVLEVTIARKQAPSTKKVEVKSA